MKRLTDMLRNRFSQSMARRRRRRKLRIESLESRDLFAADTLPVLMVIADQQDFYYQEYGDTRASIEAAGLEVQVAATTTNPSTPHAGSGQGAESGVVVPDLSLASVDADDYSAIVFVGGWGSSMYQYDFPGDYSNNRYDGDLATKQIVNNLIGDFLDSDKHVAAICHGVTVLAWARVDGVSPLDGKLVSVPYIGSPAGIYNGQWYNRFELGQYEQAVANGAIANTASGQYGDPTTVADDVIVDGRIITAENYDAALYFGQVIAQEVLAAAESGEDPPVEEPVNQAPSAGDALWTLDENSAAGAFVGQVLASDPDAGQTLSYAIVAGNDGGAFAIDPATGGITVANASALDFETQSVFALVIEVVDDADLPLGTTAQVTIELLDVDETPPSAPVSVYRVGDDLIVQGSEHDDVIYFWSGAANTDVGVWMNGVFYGMFDFASGGSVIAHGADGNDQIYATDVRMPVSIFGEGGHDQITGGSAGDLLDGGDGVDRIWGGAGDDLIRGGAGNDVLRGHEGNDILLGGDGDDYLEGQLGNDILIGGAGRDRAVAGDGEDLLIGGTTSYDHNDAALLSLLAAWTSHDSFQERVVRLTTGLPDGTRLAWGDTVHDDGVADGLCGGLAADLVFAGFDDQLCPADGLDFLA